MQVRLSKGQITRRKLLEATARCISKVGIEKTSFTEIAKEAQVKRPLVAYHFPKKNDVFYRVILYISEKLNQSVLNHRDNIKGREGIKNTITEYLNFFQENKHYFHCFFHLFYMASIEERYRFLNTKMANRVLSRFRFDVEHMLLSECGGVNIAIVESFSEEIYKTFIGSLILHMSANLDDSEEQFRRKWFSTLKIQLDLVVKYQRQLLQEN